MIYHSEAVVQQLSIHQVGNKLNEEQLILSPASIPLEDDVLNTLLMQFFLHPFEKTNEVYHFTHSTEDLSLNEVYHFAELIFKHPGDFHEHSQQIARLLYDNLNHPKIKKGELYVCYFKQLQIEGELHDAIGIFKSESKEPYLNIAIQNKFFALSYQPDAINLKKLDKGCIIFDTDRDLGYKVVVADQTNRQEAQYWIDEFLKLKIRNDDYNQTKATLQVYRQFVVDHMDNEFEITRTDKIDMLNRSIKYFKENDQFDLEEFGQAVIRNEQGFESFKQYKNSFEQEFETTIADSFSINDAAVKKQSRVYKSVLKLDKNFHIYIHGSKEMIERGFDEERNLNYYKVYFREEE